MRILGIETSCDDTGVALIEASGEFGDDFQFQILGNALISQIKEHAQYGGVFPNVAKREHGRNLVPILGEVLRQADMLDAPPDTPEEVIKKLRALLEREPDLFVNLSSFFRSTGKPPIDAIAVTVGPGLEPALWVGINFAKALSQVWSVPIVPVNHMEGHIVISALWDRNDEGKRQKAKGKIEFPILSLLISGGHTELVLSRKWMQYEILGQTRDDAIGEAFDKVARLLGLPYPGGPEISRLATLARNDGHTMSVMLPRPMMDSKDYDFSFSGLKTAVLRLVNEHQPLTDDIKKAIAKEFEDATADVLIAKTMRAVEEYGAQTLVVGGGVSANAHIRAQLSSKLQATSYKLLIPPRNLATDNALMIALAGYFRACKKEFATPDNLMAQGNLKLA